MKARSYSAYKILNHIILFTLMVFSLSLTSLSYKQEVAVAQGDSESYTWRILSLQEENKQEEALEAADEYMHRFNTREVYSFGNNAKGNTFLLMGEYTKAIYAYQEALKYDDGTNEFIMLMNIGNLQHSLGDYTDAIAYYEEAIISLDSNDLRRYWLKMHIALSDFYMLQGDTVILEQAYSSAKPILHKIDNYLNSYNKGNAYSLASTIAFQLGRFNDAIQLSKAYVNIKKTDSAKLSLATDLLYSGNKVEANAVLRGVDLENVSKCSIALWYWLKGDVILARRNLERYFDEEYSSDVARENAMRVIRNDEILPQDLWKEARGQSWFRELVYPGTVDYSGERNAEQPHEVIQEEGEEGFINENRDNVLDENATTVFSTKYSNVFHKPDCSKLNKSEGLIEFTSSQQASEAGNLPCNYCRP